MVYCSMSQLLRSICCPSNLPAVCNVQPLHRSLSHFNTAPLVLDAVTTPLPKDVTPNYTIADITNAKNVVSSPVVGPSTALEMLIIILKNAEPSQKFPAEMRMNLCSLLAELGKDSLKTVGGKDMSAESGTVRLATKDLLESAAGSAESMALASAARKALLAWGA